MAALVYGLIAFVLIWTFVTFYFFFSVIIALTIYSLQKLYPIGLGIAEWVTARRNLVPFVLFMLLTMAITNMLLIGAYLLALNVHWVGYLLIALLILLLAVVTIIFDGAMVLAIILWIVRLSHWAFAGFRKVLWRLIRGKHAPERAAPLPARLHIVTPPGVKPTYRGRQRVEKPYPLVPSTEEKARQKAKAKARAKAQAKAKAIEKARRANALAKAQAIEKQMAKELAKAQAIQKARAKALAEAQANAKGKAVPKKTKPEETIKPKPKPKQTKLEETSKPKLRRRRRPRPRKL